MHCNYKYQHFTKQINDPVLHCIAITIISTSRKYITYDNNYQVQCYLYCIAIKIISMLYCIAIKIISTLLSRSIILCEFPSLVGQDHPTIWKLIEVLQAECARVDAVLLQDDRGIRPKKRTKKVYSELQKRLQNLCQDRLSGRKSLPQFLRGVSHNLRAGQPKVQSNMSLNCV